MLNSLLFVAWAAFAAAYTTPTAQCTDGCNPIYTPTQFETVPAGTPFNLTWGPTTSGTVSILLLAGPSNNLIVQYSIADNIPNSGSLLWTPSTQLPPQANGGYGLQLINDADGTYQWSNYFGISNPSFSSSSGTVSSTVSETTTTAQSGTGSSSTANSSPATTTSVIAGNSSSASTAADSGSSFPSSYSNSTASITSAIAGVTTLTATSTASATSAVATSAVATQSSNDATLLSAQYGGAFAVILAALAI